MLNRPKLVGMCGYKLAKFHGNILSLSENSANSIFFWRGATFLTHTVYTCITDTRDAISF